MNDPARGCAPMPLSIDTDVAFVVDHESVEDCPLVMEVGLAANMIASGSFTVTVACFVTVPPAPVAVSVYVVVAVGLTERLPLSGRLPRPLSIVTEVAF